MTDPENPNAGSSDFDLNEIQSEGIPEEENPFEYGEPMASDVTAICDIPVQISAVLGPLPVGRGQSPTL